MTMDKSYVEVSLKLQSVLYCYLGYGLMRVDLTQGTCFMRYFDVVFCDELANQGESL